MTNLGSSRNLLEAAKDTIEELQIEAKMWESNARKLMLNLDILREEFNRLGKKKLCECMVETSGRLREDLKVFLPKFTGQFSSMAENQENTLAMEYFPMKLVRNDITTQDLTIGQYFGHELPSSSGDGLCYSRHQVEYGLGYLRSLMIWRWDVHPLSPSFGENAHVQEEKDG
ncbi:hypothetical protein T459_11787 [Capsicum annuum]|uniref:Uncharacterized protein n=1 Tax=Capsicum annuum TaxID=4072 RepID=A0A2G2ZN55_CAPAN|nr:hypothetical protein T459_11787 [Capsicum annuum]